MAFMSSVSRFLPSTRLTRFGRVISRLSLMFSVIVKPGSSMIPDAPCRCPCSIASCGDWMLISAPSRLTVPLKPPVEWMTGIPNRMFISVDLPAPFSPSSA